MSAQTAMAFSDAEVFRLEIHLMLDTVLMVVWMLLCFQQHRFSQHVLTAIHLCFGPIQMLWHRMRHISQGFSVCPNLIPSSWNMKSSSLS
jgi:hypothetical protein